MPKRIELLTVSDFTGGLNLVSDQFQLRGADTPDCLNVDLDPRGGFKVRDAARYMNGTALSNTPKNIWRYAKTDGTDQIIVQDGNDLAYSTGGNFTAVNPDALTTAGVMRAVTFKDACYVQRYAENAVVKWDGSASSVLGTTFNDNIASPNQGDMPKAKCITAWMGYVWVGNTVETGTAYQSRVRWSHPNQPEDWRTADYIDIDIGHDGDEITAMVPLGDRLIVFKRNSTYVVTGYDPDTFAVYPISMQYGAISQEAVALTESGVYFYSTTYGLMFLKANLAIDWLFKNLFPLISAGTLTYSALSKISVGWLNRRVWLSVPESASTTANAVYVYDPSIGKDGQGWTKYSLPLGPMIEWQRVANSTMYLACHASAGRVEKLHQTVSTSATGDDLLNAGYTTINAYYVTRWVDAEQPALIKRWRRPEIVFDGGFDGVFLIDAWREWDPSVIYRSGTITISAGQSNVTTLIWATPDVDQAKWNDNTWGGDGSPRQEVHRTSGLGRARSVRMKFTGPVSTPWAVNAITFKYVPLRVRG